MEKHSVTYRHQPIEFELQRKAVKNVNVRVKPDMSIIVSAAPAVPFDFIEDLIRRRGDWILKTVKYFERVQPEYPNPKEYVSGESFMYLGKQARLKVLEGRVEEVRYTPGWIELTVRDTTDATRKERLLADWFHARAEAVFQEVFDEMFPLLAKYGILRPTIMMRRMKARWGSCLKAKGIILLNSELIKAPKYCIQYVVLHELIHFKYSNHDRRFYAFMTALMPDWKTRKTILDEEIVKSL